MGYESKTVTVIPSGDMARGHFYDRNANPLVQFFLAGATGVHAWTVRWTYTVPTDRMAQHSVLMEYVSTAMSAGTFAYVRHRVSTDGGSNYYRISHTTHESASGMNTETKTLTATFFLDEAHILTGETFSNDGVNAHTFMVTSALTEFDK